MRSTIGIPILAVLLTGVMATGAAAGPTDPPTRTRMTVMSFNVLCSFCDRTNYDPWEERLAHFADIIRRHDADVIGLQELSKESEVSDILGVVPEFDAFYYKDPAGPKARAYPDQTILWRRERFEKLESGTYWLSATPDEPWSKGWAKAQFWRLVGWVRLRDRTTGREFHLTNTHFDNNTPNQKMSAPVLLDRVKPWAETLPCIVVGDFNSKPDSEAYKILTGGADGAVALKNTFDMVKEPARPANREPAPAWEPTARIDHIFVTGKADFTAAAWSVDLHVYGEKDRFPSDHRGISATIEF